MTDSPASESDQARQAALERYNILDTAPEPAFDDLARLTSRICQTPVALISFVDREREWFKARLGLNASFLTRDVAFSVYAIQQNDVLIVRDTQADPRFAGNPLVIYPPHIRFYAGVTLLTAEGVAIGTLSVLDLSPRDLTPQQVDGLRILSRQVMALLELRRKDAALAEAEAEYEQLEDELDAGGPRLVQRLVDALPGAYILIPARRSLLYANRRLPPWELTPDQPGGVFSSPAHADDRQALDEHFRRLEAARDGEVLEVEYRVKAPDGGWRWFCSRDTVFARGEDGSVAQVLGTAQDITDRRERENAQRQGEARYRQWIEAAPAGVWVFDSRERTALVNPRMGELLGYEAGELLGAPLSDFLDESEQDSAAAYLERVRQGRGEQRELRFKRKDGTELWALVSGAPVLDAQGQYAGALAIVADMTAHRQAEQAIRESEERFRQVAENLRQALWIASADGRQVLYASPAYESIWGQSRQALHDNPGSFMEAVHPEDRERVAAAQQENQQSEFAADYRIVRPDGSIRWIGSRTFPIRDEQGAVYRVAGIAEDITERIETEAALRKNEGDLRSLLEAIPDMVFRFDAQGQFTAFKSAPENRQELIIPPEAFLGRHYRDVLPPDVSEVMEEAFQRALAENSIQTYEYSLTRPDGQTQHYEARLSIDANGSALGIVRNISRRKQAEAGLEAQKRLFQNLLAIARATAALPSLEATLQSALDVSVMVTGATRGLLLVFDAGGRVTRNLSSGGQKAEGPALGFVDGLLDRGLEGWVLRERKPLVVLDTQADERWLALEDETFVAGSALGVPIVYGESLVGILTLLHEQKAYFTDEHLSLMQAAADQMALVLRNAQIFEQTRRQAQELFLLNSITRAALESSGPDDLIQTLADRMGELIGADGCYITLWDSVEQRVVPKAASGALRASYAAIAVEPGEVTLTGSVLAAGRALVVEDVLDTPYLSRRIAEQFPSRSLLGLPLIARAQTLGAVLIGFNQPHTFTDDEVALCEQAAGQMALALSNAILFQAIGEERSRLRAIIEASRDGILLVGVNRRLLVCNDIAMRLLGVHGQPEDWIGKTVPDVLMALRHQAPNAVRMVISEVRRIQNQSESSGEGEYELLGRMLLWHQVAVQAQGVLLGRLVVMRDVTEERSLERVRNDLTHMMVHDLRSPLTAIIGASDVLTDMATGLTPNDRGTLDLIRDGADRMLGLINDILEVSQLESNRMPIERQAVQVAVLMAEILQLHMSQIDKKQLRLVNDLPHDLPPVDADNRLIERVVQNLLSNAVKFTPEGGTLHITAAPVDAPGAPSAPSRGQAPSASPGGRAARDRPRGPIRAEGDAGDMEAPAAPGAMLKISIGDTGPGIPPEIQARLFEKFVRGDHKEHGSGLGLAFCRLAIEAHQGRIWVDSEPGKGATFHFTLPVYDSSLARQDDRDPEASS